MSDTATTAPVDPTPTPVKPGIRTTEWWLSLAAIGLTLMYTSGVVTNNVVLAVAGVAATWLTAAGYKVSRTMLKLAGVLLLAFVFAAPQLACTAAQRANTKVAAIDCLAANGAAIGGVASSMRGDCLTPTGATDWGCVTSKAITAGVTIGGCAFLKVLAEPAGVPTLLAATPDPSGREAFERYRASQAGGATYQTSSGPI